MGSVLCNACGLFLKLHHRPRPISLKTDVIKSRNRVKATGQGARKRPNGESNGGLPAAHPDTSADPSFSTRRVSHKFSSAASDRSNSPISRIGTPLTQGGHPSNIAPQHLFDNATQGFESPSLPSFTLRQPSPSSSSANGASHDPTAPVPAYDSSSLGADALKTRVSELEVINGLFRGRVSELEASEQDTRRQLEAALAREQELRKRIEELELQAALPYGQRQAKRAKLNGDANGYGSAATSNAGDSLDGEAA